jgi:SAM-dependent methyltransferase
MVNSVNSVPEQFNVNYFKSYVSVSRLREKGDKPYLYSYWSRYLRGLKPRGKLLDVACGLGFFIKRMQDTYQTFGIDISGYSVEESRKNAARADVRIASAAALPFNNDYFDIVTAFDIIEHLKDPGLFLTQAQAVLKKGGLLVISTPNPNSLGARLKPGTEWAGRRDITHLTILPPEEWRSLIEKHGFSVIREGTDFLWDTPYFKVIPAKLQWLTLVGLTWALVWMNGFYPWKFGENYFCVAKKSDNKEVYQG